jgi:hypothetical protein
MENKIDNESDNEIEVIYDPILKAHQIFFKKQIVQKKENKISNRKRKTENDTPYSYTKSKCNRCGRYGHFILQCYAKLHRNGMYLGYD